jgi:hypothetical protein
LLAAVLAVAGCGGEKTGEVTGTVTVDGHAPPVGSSISFIPADGKSPSAGGGIEDGKYTATKVPVGPAKVRIIVPKFASGKAPKPQAGPGAEGDRVVGELVLVDDQGRTELTYEVKSGRQEKNWELKTK